MRNSNDETISEQAQHWVVRLASGSMTAVELAAFKTWLGRSDAHQRAFADERRFWHRLSPLGETFERLDREPVSSAAATAASASPVRRGYRVVRTGRMRWRHSAIAGLALAACLLLFMAGPPLLTRLEADHVSGFDRTVSTTLSDGSRVTLNRGSAIRVDIGDAVRRVELLRGEVFVEVKPDVTHPFRVVAGAGVSEAVGTAYAVRRGETGTRVAVAEGRVAVTGAGEPGISVSLVAGEGVRYADGRFIGGKFTVNAENALAWRENKIVFVDRPLREALAELERYHRGRIVLLGEGRAFRPVSGVIDLDQLDDGVMALAATHGLHVVHLTPYLTILR